MRHAVTLFILVALSCAPRSVDTGIPLDDLPQVLVDVYVAEAKAEATGGDAVEARAAALERRGYSVETFDETMAVLVENPEIAKDVYQAVLDSVIFEQRELRARALGDSL